MQSLVEVLTGNRYPGRCVIWARTGDGEVAGAYFLTGRSAASKERTLHLAGGRLVVAPDGEAAHDPLRHYVAARADDDWLVYGNGEQVDTVAGRLLSGATPPEALSDLSYEPDPPIFTSRITVVADARRPGRAWFGAARHSASGREAADLQTVAVADLAPGDVVLMTTYRSDGVSVATATPYVEARTAAHDRQDLLEEVWNALDPAFRIAATAFPPGSLADATILA